MYTPPQRNFDGTRAKQIIRAMRNEQVADDDSPYWQHRSRDLAQQCADILGTEEYRRTVCAFPDAWFEARTWKAQTLAYARLLALLQTNVNASPEARAAAFDPDPRTPDEKAADRDYADLQATQADLRQF